MSELIPKNLVEQKIIMLRGKKVMLSQDLAELYGVEVKVLNQAVKRNIERFPGDFMFQLTSSEVTVLRSQIVTLEPGRGRYSKYLSYAFTEQGVAMLSSVLRSRKAIRVNIEIMRAFARLREILATNKDFARRLEELERKFNTHDHQFQSVFDAIRELMKVPEKPKRRIGFLEESRAAYRVN
jgi:phage regulator Rha-like protein